MVEYCSCRASRTAKPTALHQVSLSEMPILVRRCWDFLFAALDHECYEVQLGLRTALLEGLLLKRRC